MEAREARGHPLARVGPISRKKIRGQALHLTLLKKNTGSGLTFDIVNGDQLILQNNRYK